MIAEGEDMEKQLGDDRYTTRPAPAFHGTNTGFQIERATVTGCSLLVSILKS